VRIRLFEIYRPSAVRLTVTSGSLLLYRNGDSVPYATLEEGSTSEIRAQNQLVMLRTGGLETIRIESLELVSADSSALFSLMVTDGGRQSETRTYAGEIRFLIDPENSGALIPINLVDLETYVAAVVTSEYGLDDLQGNMAMAILARTYAVRSRGKFGESYDHVDHSISQVYHGVDDLKPEAIQAARLTSGLVLVYENELIEALYHAESGGHTADNETVWTGGKAIPYLRGTDDPYANKSPYANWTFTANRSKLLAALKRAYGGTITGIQIGDVGPDGRVRSMVVLRRQGKRTIPANEFRLLFLRTFGQYSMKSTRFSVKRVGSNYRFDGQGFGHGVGLSQWGAHEMANQGFGYQDILAFYFTDTQVVSIDDLSTPALAEASSKASSGDTEVPVANPAPVDTTLFMVSPRETEARTASVPKRKRSRRIGW
jgi:stage II sporulation protein D